MANVSRGYLGKNPIANFRGGRGESTSSFRGRGRTDKSPGLQSSDGESASQSSFRGAQGPRGAGRGRASDASRGRGSVRGVSFDASRNGHTGRQRSETPPRGGSPNPSTGAGPTFGQVNHTSGQSQDWRRTENYGTPEYTSKMHKLHEEHEKQIQLDLDIAVKEGKMLAPGAQVTLDKAIPMVGTCEEMCPAREMIKRIQFNIDLLEPEKTKLPNGKSAPDESKIVKIFHRPDAGMPQPPPSQYRTPQALRRTLDYIWSRIDSSEGYSLSMQRWAWDRTRGLRQDFRVQSSTCNDPDNARLCIGCFEEIARFHIYTYHVFANTEHPDYATHDVFQEREQLTATLVELNTYYEQSKDYQSPNQAEFRAYTVLFAYSDPRQSLDVKMLNWTQEMLNEPLVQFSSKIREAANTFQNQLGPANRLGGGNQAVAQGNFAKVFRLLKNKEVTYLMACLIEIQCQEIRSQAMSAIWYAYWRHTKANTPSTPINQRPQIPLRTIVEMLGFDSEEEAASVCSLYDMQITDGYVQVTSTNKGSRPSPSVPRVYSKTIVEKKRQGLVPSAIFRAIHPKDALKAGLIDKTYLEQSQSSLKDTQLPSTVKSNPFAAAAVMPNGSTQSPGGTGQNAFGAPQSSFGSAGENPFGASQPSTGGIGQNSFGAPQSSFGSAGKNPFGGPQPPTGGFGQTSFRASPSSFGSAGQNPFGASPPPTGGIGQSSFGASQPSLGGGGQTPFGAPEPSTGGIVQNPFGNPKQTFGSGGQNPFGASPPSAGGIGQNGFIRPPTFPTKDTFPTAHEEAGLPQQEQQPSNPFQQNPQKTNPFGGKSPTTSFLNPSSAQGQGQLASGESQKQPSFSSVFDQPKPATASPAQQPLPALNPFPTSNVGVVDKDDEESLFVPEDKPENQTNIPKAPSFFPSPAPNPKPAASAPSPFTTPIDAPAPASLAPPPLSPNPAASTPSRKDLFTSLPGPATAPPVAPVPASKPGLSFAQSGQAEPASNPFAHAKVPESILRPQATTSVKPAFEFDSLKRVGTAPLPAAPSPFKPADFPMPKPASHGSSNPVAANTRSVPPPPPKPSKKEQLGKLADLFLMEQGGMMRQFLEHTIGASITSCMRKVQKEKELKRIADARQYLLAKKYIRRWKDFAWKGTLRRMAKRRRANFAQSMRDLAASTQGSKIRDSSPASHFQPFTSLTNPSASTMQPPPKPVAKHKHRASLPADSKLQEQLQQQPGRQSGSDNVEMSNLQRKSVLGPRRSATAANQSRPRASTENLAEETLLTTERLMRKASRMIKGRTDTTQSDYFKLKALGLDPDTPFFPKTQTRKRPLDDIVDEAARKSRISPAKTMTDSAYLSNLSTTPQPPITRGVSASQGLDSSARHRSTILNGKQDINDDEFFAQIASIKQQMADDTAWFREYREQSERSSLERASETPKERRLREWKPSKNRTEARWERDGLPSFLRAAWTPRESVSRSTSRVTDAQPAPNPTSNGQKASISQSEEQYLANEDEDEEADGEDGQDDVRGYYDADGDYYEDEEILEGEEEYEEGYADEEDGILDTQAFIAANNNSAFASKGASADDAIEL